MKKNLFSLAVVFVVLTGSFSFAQFSVVPIPRTRNTKSIPKTHTVKRLLKTEQDTLILQLPFFEDFATTTVGELDTTKWFESNVFVNNGIPLNPPTKNAATFDGTKANGTPYSQDFPTREGVGDTLLSQRIDLSQDNRDLFLSFMWQARGNAETPDPSDYLRLDFLDNEGNWQQAWEKRGGENLPTKRFEHAILPIEDEIYFHQNFQFRFTAYNRLSGIFDVWNIDYIYLNSDRSATDTVFLDLAASRTPEFFTKPYSAIPYTHFWADTTRYLTDTLRSSVNNLDDRFNVLAYRCEVRNAETEEVLGYWRGENDDRLISSVLVDGFERNVPLVARPYAKLLPQNADSMKIRYEFQANTREPDENFGGLYTRDNDTISQTSIFKDFYAYDDGSAEFAAGINQRQGQLAYQYYVGQPDVMTHIDVYFAQIGRSVQNQTFNIRVWKKIDFSRSDIQDDILLTQNVVLRYTDSLNKFMRIKLSRPLEISDTVYIGIQQLSDLMLPIGLDVQTNSQDRMFFNVRNYWEQNQTVEGSLMLRPVFSKEVVTGIEDENQQWADELMLYPNPNSTQTLRIRGNVNQVNLIDLTGKQLGSWALDQFANEQEIKLPTFLRKGMYLVQCQYQNFYTVKKLIIE